MLVRVKPLLHQDHAVNGSCHGLPAHEDLHLTTEVCSTPHGQNIIVSAIAHTLAAGKNLLHIGVVKVALNKIAAILAAIMVGKERGNRHSMVFQGITDTEKLLLFGAVVEVGNVARRIEIMSDGLKDRCRCFSSFLRLCIA